VKNFCSEYKILNAQWVLHDSLVLHAIPVRQRTELRTTPPKQPKKKRIQCVVGEIRLQTMSQPSNISRLSIGSPHLQTD